MDPYIYLNSGGSSSGSANGWDLSSALSHMSSYLFQCMGLAIAFVLFIFLLKTIVTRRGLSPALKRQALTSEGKATPAAEEELASEPSSATDATTSLPWRTLLARGDKLLEEWQEKSTSADYLLSHPLLAQYGDAQVQRVVTLVQQVTAYRTESAPAGESSLEGSTYGRAVEELTGALPALLLRAKQVKSGFLSQEEQVKVSQAQKLLALLRDRGASAGERVQAYERVRELMEELGLMANSDLKARLELEAKPLLMLEAS